MRLAIILIIYIAICAAALANLYGPLKRALCPEKKAAFSGAAGPSRQKKWPVRLVLGVLTVLLSFPAIGAMLPDGPAGYFFQRWGNVFIGYLLYFSVPLLLIWMVLLVVRFVYRRRKREKWRPRRFHSAALIAVLLIGTVIINLCGAQTAQNVRVTSYEIPKEQLGQTEPLRIVLIADLHIGVNSNIGLYEDMVDRINEQDPDLVLVAGDLFTSAFGAMEEPDAYAAVMRKIDATYGTYVVYGNHDVDEPLFGGFTYNKAEDAIRNPGIVPWISACGWKLLTDETVTLPELNGLVLAGRRDEKRPGDGVKVRMSLGELLAKTDPEAPILLLEHEPVELGELQDYGIDLTVCGHTHDGQIFPGNVWGRIHDPQSYGFKNWGSCMVVVTSGVGFYGPPIRVGTISEIVVIDAK